MDTRPPSSAPAPLPPQRSSLLSSWLLLKPLLAVMALLLLLAGGLMAGARWLLMNEEGARWFVGHLPNVQVTGWQGALLDKTWSAQKLRVQWAGGKEWLEIDGLKADGLKLVLRPHPGAWLGVDVQQLSARRVALETGPRGPRPIPLPLAMDWPLHLRLQRAQVAEFQLDALDPFTTLQVQGLELDPRPAQNHRVQQLQTDWRGLHLQAGGSMGHQRPFGVDLQGTLAPQGAGDQPVWAAVLGLKGELARMQLQATLRGVPRSLFEGPASASSATSSAKKSSPTTATVATPVAAPAVDVTAGLRVLEDWPLAALLLQTQDLDLSALQSRAPRTALSGTVQINTRAKDAPISAAIDLQNALPGRWDSGRLPLRQVRGDVVASLAERQRLEFKQLDLLFADAEGPAGRWTGSATWLGHELKLQSQVQDLAPHKLDNRVAAMVLSGPFNATLLGLPSPDPAAGAAATAPTLPPRQASWDFNLEGRLEGSPQAVQLALAGTANDQRIDIVRAQARTAAASAEFTASLLRKAKTPLKGDVKADLKSEWQLLTQGAIKDFDPLPWWPGERNTVWHKGPHRLNARWALDLNLPAGSASLPAAAWVQRLAGNGTLQVQDSVLAGLPVSADFSLVQQPAKPGVNTASGTPTTLRAELRAAGNVVKLEGRGDPSGDGSYGANGGTGTNNPDRWRIDISADKLNALGPWASLHPALADGLPQQGELSASITAEGRWPLMRTEGSARVLQLRAGAYRLASGNAVWKLDTAADAPLELRVDLAGLASAPPGQTFSAELLHAEVTGTLRNHRIQLSGATPARAPAWLLQLLGLQAGAGSRTTVQAQGSWLPEVASAGDTSAARVGLWRGQVDRVLVAPWDGAAASVTGLPNAASAVWAEARDLRAELELGPGGRLLSLKADAGRMTVGAAARDAAAPAVKPAAGATALPTPPAGTASGGPAPPGAATVSAALAAPISLRWDDVQVDLRPARPSLQLRAQIDPFDVAPLLARLQPTMGWRGNLQMGAQLNIRAADKLDADLVLQRTEGDLHIESADGLQLLGLTELRITASAHDGVWQLSPVLKGRGVGEVTGTLRALTSADLRWPADTAPLEGSVTARAADIGIWATWVPPGWRLAGEVSTTANLSGTVGAPRYTGAVRGTGVGVRNLLQGVNVSGGEVLVLLEGETARIERFTLRGGDGRIDVTGSAVLTSTPSAQLNLKADRFRALGRLDRMLITSGQAALKIDRNQGRLDGRFTIDEGYFDATAADAPSLDADVTIRGQADALDNTTSTDPNAAAAAKKRNFVLNVDVDLGDKLQVRGRGLDTTLQGALRVTNPEGRLAVNGSIRSERGTYAAYGQKLEIERGVLTFTGPVDNPRLDVLALRPNIDNRVGVAISGAAQAPRVRLYAEPDMSDTDKLSWLVLGRAPDGLGRADTALLQRAAVALLAGEGEGPTDQLMKSLGIDDISLRQGEGEVRETVITLGKQLSRRWYVGYERGVNAASGTWQLIYRIAQRFTLRAQSGLENSLDVIWIWRVQETPADAAMRKSTITPK